MYSHTLALAWVGGPAVRVALCVRVALGERGRHFAVQAAWRARRMDTGRLSLAEHLDRPRRESWH